SATAQRGESCYGVFVGGDSAVDLLDCDVKAGTGGDGGDVEATGPGVGDGCGGVDDCGDGVNGIGGGDGNPASAGTFVADGYVPGDGSNAEAGKPGHNGTAGGAGTGGTCYYP